MGAETEIVTLCRTQLEDLPGIQKVTIRKPTRGRGTPPGDLGVVLETDVGQFAYAGEVKSRLTPAALDHWLVAHPAGDPARSPKQKSILLADYVSPENERRLRQADVDYVDTAGNALINRPPKLHIFISAARPRARVKSRPARLFMPSGLQVLFTLLVDPAGADMPYRKLAARSGVALGSIAVVMNELERKGHLLRRRAGWRLVGRRELLDRWVAGYADQLRPKLGLGTFTAREKDPAANWQHLRAILRGRGIEAALTGGLAADELTHHYRGDVLVAFVSEWPRGVLEQLRWLPSAAGPITILRQFAPVVGWSRGEEQALAHPLLVYAELLHSGRERERETARLIYERHLERLAADDGD
jgi:hypothetical protein